MSNPAADMLKALVASVEAVGKPMLQHNNQAYIAFETRRVLDYQDSVDTAAQLARYGVSLHAGSQNDGGTEHG
jgi:hypothetical protein